MVDGKVGIDMHADADRHSLRKNDERRGRESWRRIELTHLFALCGEYPSRTFCTCVER